MRSRISLRAQKQHVQGRRHETAQPIPDVPLITFEIGLIQKWEVLIMSKTQCLELLKQPVEPSEVPEEIREYRALCRELGITNPKAELESLKMFLAENGITVFPQKAVDEYLRKKARTEGGFETYWCWKPIRRRQDARMSGAPTDTPAIPQPMFRMTGVEVMRRQYFELMGTLRPDIDWGKLAEEQFDNLPHGSLSAALYIHPIPLPVLLTVKKIDAEFPDALFFASDYEVHKPDPFLAVTLPLVKELFIIERWDEPGFRM